MMKYKGTFIHIFPLMLKKYMKEQFGSEITNKSLKGARSIYKDMLNKCDDIGRDNPMAKNIYMSFVFLAIWEAADGAIDVEGYRKVIQNFVKSPLAGMFMGGKDLNKPETLQAAKDKFHAMQAWADAHPQYKDKTWDFNFDESKHRDGSYYHFTRCPIEAFARKYGYLEVLPLCCELDYPMTEAMHGVLRRDYTLATGGDMCDYWIVPDQITNPQ